MSRWVIFIFLLLSSCAMFKEKRHLKTDSLNYVNRTEQLGLMGQWHRSAYQFKDSNSSQTVLIRADAPFKWQADSGLSGKAGNYQLYLIHRGKVLRAESQSGKQDLAVNRQQEQQEVHKSVKENKHVSSSSRKIWVFVLLVVLGLVWLFFGRRVR